MVENTLLSPIIAQLKKLAAVIQSLDKRFGLRHYTLVGALVLYLLLGGYMFWKIEKPDELQRLNKQMKVALTVQEKYIELFLNISGNNCAVPAQSDEYRTNVDNYLRKYTDELNGGPLTEETIKSKEQWRLIKAVEFATILISTIGYGDIACKTTWGRIMTVLYCFVGIPFMLIVLNRLGHLLHGGCLKLYCLALKSSMLQRKRVVDYVNRNQRKLSRNGIEAKDAGTAYLEEVEAQANTDDPEYFPWFLSIPVILIYLLFVSIIFYLIDFRENTGSFLDAFYFSFITLSTVGLGDVVLHPKNSYLAVGLHLVVLLLGLSLLSLFFTSIYNEIEQKYMKMVEILQLIPRNNKLEAPKEWRHEFEMVSLARRMVPTTEDDDRIVDILDKRDHTMQARMRKSNSMPDITELPSGNGEG